MKEYKQVPRRNVRNEREKKGCFLALPNKITLLRESSASVLGSDILVKEKPFEQRGNITTPQLFKRFEPFSVRQISLTK